MFLLTHPLSVVKTLPREVVIADAGESLYWISHGRFLFLAVRDDGYENVYHVLPWHRYPTSNNFLEYQLYHQRLERDPRLRNRQQRPPAPHTNGGTAIARRLNVSMVFLINWCFNGFDLFCIFATATMFLILFTIAQDEIDGVSAFFSIILITSSILVSFSQVFFC